jgi:hypothetical protein
VHSWKVDGKFHRLPEAFVFPDVDAFGVWRMWWLGNPGKEYPPFHRLQPTDFSRPQRKMYSEWTVLVKHLVAAIEKTLSTKMARPDNETEAHALHCIGIANVPLKASRNQRKDRTERAATTLRRIREAIYEANPNARKLPFRKRKRQRK